LVEKVMGFEESCLAMLLGHFLLAFVQQRKLGIVSGPDGPARLSPGKVRLPDVAFFARARLRGRKKRDPILDLAPDLAVEILSKGNTRREMDRKLRDYFAAGTRLVWFVDPRKRTVRVYTEPDKPTVLSEGEILDGGAVLPGFTLELRALFAELDQ
jgi:Uma2 family endonuclease